MAKLADAPDLGSGGAILRGSSPLSGKCFNTRYLQHKPNSTINALSQQMQACVTVFMDVSFSRLLALSGSGFAGSDQ